MARSKGGPSAAAAAAAPARLSGGVLTQILLSLYFFLAGAAVSTSRVLWLLPAATALSAAAFAVAGLAARLLPARGAPPAPDAAALRSLQLVHLAYSSLAACAAAAYVAARPAALLLAAPQPADTLAQALVAASAGFFGFVLWAEVGARLYTRSYSAVVHYTVLLVLFSAAAHKSVNTGFLAVTLLGEVNSAVVMARRLAAGAGLRRAAAALAAADGATFVVFRLALHGAMAGAVVLNPQAFTGAAYYVLAAAGMLYMNVVNAKHALGMLRAPKERAD